MEKQIKFYCKEIFFLFVIVCFVKADTDCSTKIKPIQIRKCPDGLRDDGTSCWKDTYPRGAGRIPDKLPCQNGQRDDGTSCWLDSYGRGVGRPTDKAPCGSGLRDDGTSCWSDARIYGKGCCCTLWGCCNKCPSGYRDDGCTCRKLDVGIKTTLFDRLSCKATEDKYGVRCYPRCKSGFSPVGCCICQPHGGPRIVLSLASRHRCRENEDLHGALCYPKCKEGYKSVGCCLCEPMEGPGIKITNPERQFCEGNDLKFNGICIDTKGCSPSELANAIKKNTTMSEEMLDQFMEELEDEDGNHHKK
ncbi:cubilin homolog [Ruditapes philippinarum]|uniref:cubilin homolog n=1 Tax=Ruditapes philippinarum TaxID=129788 RepID=UPI00295B9EEB|nr:cubilin homolog [Ruditapes philippinarum]